MRIAKALSTRLLFGCALFLLAFTKTEAQGFAWAQGIVSTGSGGNSGVGACTFDANNNGYFVGMFNGTADFDPGIGVQNLTAVGTLDMYILKKDAAGNFLWVKQIAGINSNSSMCMGTGIEVDAVGNVYIGGSFVDSYDFDPGPGVYPLYSDWGGYSFVLKLNASGDFVWVKDIGSPTNDAAIVIQSLKMDAAWNIFFACNFSGNPLATLDVDPGPGVHNLVYQGSTGYDIVIEKLDSAGNFIWAKVITGPSDQSMPALALDKTSNIYITGQISSTADFDPGPGVANLTAAGDYDIFIAKYDSAGNYLWAGRIGSGGLDYGHGIATDTFGNVVLTGSIGSGITDLNPGAGVYNITTSSADMFVVKLRSDGSFAWGNSAHPSGNDAGTAIVTDGLGNIYTTGSFFGTADFDPGPGVYSLSGVAYVQKLDSAGNFGWARVFAGQYPTAIALDNANDIYVVGWLQNGGDFDPGPGVFNISGGHVGFIEKLCGTSLALSASDTTLCNGNSVTLTTPAITGATYTWTLNGNVYTGGSNSITVTQAGIYEVYVNGGCPNASGPIYLSYCTGIEEKVQGGIEVYPNPFDDELAINGLNIHEQVILTDITGRVVQEWQATATALSFSTGDLSPGYYVLQVVNENGAVRVNVPVVKR